MTRYLCKLARVSLSGYYRWLSAEEARQLREEADERDAFLIKKHFNALDGKAGATRQVVAHYLSSSLALPLVERTMEQLLDRLDGNIHPEAILHSDQGMHYTHPKFRLLVSRADFKQSMSRKGNCWDNASMETFFGHMKDELEYKTCINIQELRERVNNYMEYYNSGRYQWTLKQMTPDEFRSHLLTA
ncbi:IS3 family transposase [Paenibacillus sp. KN14-4R]|uniref:IS3 family transposase n=1 Tax=Paenibacillus sp. KN14-4R TaxID=3445773 RepID=UPI003FA055BA